MLKDAELNLKLSKHIDKKYALMRYEIIMNHIRALKSL
jgi:hypothetical protein